MSELASPSARSSERGRASSWRGALLLAAALIALPLLAAHAPPRLKLIGVFPILVGIAAGGILLFAHSRRHYSSSIARCLALIAIPLVMLAFAAESYRAWRIGYQDMFHDHVLAQPGGRQILDQLNTESENFNSATKQLLAPYRQHLNPPFEWYLAERRKIAIPISPKPLTFSRTATIAIIINELILGMMAGIAAVFWNTRVSHRTPEPNQ